MRFSNCLAILALVSQGLCTVKYIKHSDQTYAWMEEIDNAPTPSRDSMKAANEKEYHHMVSDAVEENSMAPNAMAALYVWTTNNPSTRKGVLIHYSSIKMGDGKGAKASVATEEFTNSCGLSPGHTKVGLFEITLSISSFYNALYTDTSSSGVTVPKWQPWPTPTPRAISSKAGTSPSLASRAEWQNPWSLARATIRTGAARSSARR